MVGRQTAEQLGDASAEERETLLRQLDAQFQADVKALEAKRDAVKRIIQAGL